MRRRGRNFITQATVFPRKKGCSARARVLKLRTFRATRTDGQRKRPITRNFLIRPRWVVPVEPAGAVLAEHAVAVRDGRIEAVLPASDARGRFAGYEEISLARHALIPGLVNAHTHAAMSLMRGLADDLPLMRWLEEHVWPAEARHVSAQFVADGTRLACAEMLRGGITCFNDMYFFPEASLESALAAGLRSAHGVIVIEFASAYAADPADYLRKGLALRDRMREEPRASFCLAPHAPYTVSDETLKKVATLSAELDLPVHIHLHETEHEIERSVAEHGVRPLERLRRLGLVSPALIAVHAVHLEPGERELLARHGCSVVHCPSSNLKLASGFAPVAALLAAGVNVALGTDGAASNNRLDLFQEMRTAALLAKAVARDAEALPAHAALRAATLNGAQALGIAQRIGSIEPGKAADLVAVDLGALELAPCYDPVSHLVYAAGREQVTHVWVDGEPRLDGGRLVGEAFEHLDARVHLWQNSLAGLAGR
jgi:5-methylthioadenosine/S-adenosylhomocysteine deaminase